MQFLCVLVICSFNFSVLYAEKGWVPQRFTSRNEERISFKKFNRYAEVMDYLDYLGKTYPQLAKVEVLGKTSEGRNMKTITISKGDFKKPIILIDAGIHAREWAAPAAALYLIQELVEHSGEHADMLEKVDWIILPLVNPDGYEYTFTNDRMWRKTRSRGLKSSCVGVDANRNFNFHWAFSGVSKNPCSETYAGPNADSEVETRILSQLFHSSDLIKLYISFHSYGAFLLYPWGFNKTVPVQWKDLEDAATAAATAIKNVNNRDYVIGGSALTLYPAAGGSDDYAMANAGIHLAYTWELPGDDFIIPESEIQGIVEETLEGLRAFAKYVGDKFGR